MAEQNRGNLRRGVKEAVQQSTPVLIVPADTFSIFCDPASCPLFAHQVEPPPPQDRKIFGTMVFPSPVVILLEGNIEHPMKLVFHLPVRTNPIHRCLGIHWKGAEEVPVFYAADTRRRDGAQ